MNFTPGRGRRLGSAVVFARLPQSACFIVFPVLFATCEKVTCNNQVVSVFILLRACLCFVIR